MLLLLFNCIIRWRDCVQLCCSSVKKGFTHFGIAITRLRVGPRTIASAQSIPKLACAIDDYATISVNQNSKTEKLISLPHCSTIIEALLRKKTKMFVGNVEAIINSTTKPYKCLSFFYSRTQIVGFVLGLQGKRFLDF